tara:strand:+ start:535 stop:894 length:360 start_codon:yes stop_codon:yes gene_type:complete
MKWKDILKYDDIPAMFEDLRREIVEYFPPQYIGDVNTPPSIIGIIFVLIDYLESPMYNEPRTQGVLRTLLRKIDKAQDHFSDDEGHDEAFVDGNTLFYATVSGIIDKISEALKVREEYT